MPDLEGFEPLDTQLASEWSAVCESKADCPAGQQCYPSYYEWDDSTNDFNNGVICMNEEERCKNDPNIMWADYNTEYEETGEEYRFTVKCSPGATGYSEASLIVASLFSAITAMILF